MEVLGLSDRIPPSENGVDIGTPLTAEQAQVLEENIHTIFAAHPRPYWIQRLLEADVCAVEHQPPTAVFDHAQARHNQMVVQVDDPVLGLVEQVAPGIRLNGAAPAAPKPAPRVGADTQAVLAELAQPAAPSPWRKAGTPGAADSRPLLEGVKILDLGAYYAGPYSSRLLADLGAEVIKLEPTFGDQLRGIERPFFSAQAGKRSLAANLKDPDLERAARKLIDWADIIHHNMRPGAAERLGLAAEQVRAINPKAIYLYAPGWGASGPHRMRQSFAPMLSAFVGGSYEVAGQYNEPLPSVGNEDPGNGLLGAIGMLIALLRREVAGETLYCENPQLNAAMGMLAHIVRQEDGQAVGAARLDVLQKGFGALESLYATSDGWICLVARTDPEISQIEARLGVDILSRSEFATVEARREHREDLEDLLGAAFGKLSTAAAVKLFDGAQAVVVEPAGSTFVHEFMNDPLQRRLRRVAEVRHADKGMVREMDQLIRVSDAEAPAHRLAPGLGEHTDQILTWLGYGPEEIATLRARGSVR
jgi:crotonobetainyl-CoA:carnitine CoA-transferase CaiB-like acyl-CoA transferase